ncbi:MAG: phosphotransferase family protein [Dehalococcoidia bacterium]
MREEEVAAYLQHKMPDAREIEVSQLSRIPGGASRETWSFDANWREGKARPDGRASRAFILRRDPEASLLETERYVEFRVYQALQDSDVPVPEMFWLENDAQWLQRPFFIMGRLPGEASPQALVAGPADKLETIAQQKTEILARIHALDWQALGLDFLDAPDGPDGCADHEIGRWEGIMREQALEPQPILELGIAWLRAHKPGAQRMTIVHADYRTGNFLVHGDRINGVLDWEMVHLGDPLEDVGWACLRSWRWAGDARIGGLLSRAEWYRRYGEASGTSVDEAAVKFWEVLGNVKLAVIFLTGARSFAEGRSKDAVHAFTAHLNPEIETEILRLID